MNVFKCIVAFIASVVAVSVLEGAIVLDWSRQWPFLISGFIGLNVGDFFLLNAYKRIGPARTLILFGFQPLVAGGFSYFVWDEQIHNMQFLAIFFFLICLFLFSYESYKKAGQWELKGLIFAFLGVFLDSVGVILSRYGFESSPEISGLGGHLYRTVGALAGFAVILPFVKRDFWSHFKVLKRGEWGLAIVSSLVGTFLSLVCYMQAIKMGKLATVTSIVLTDPVVSTSLESLWMRVWPSRYLWLALISFAGAMFCLFYPQM